ncbi:amidophosphoribosyltransferase [Limimonas halophila]|uniref:Amidophosphoribosyltransferase n=1 Tax=Limimonas halophila TaxID=1082479 RepID=A0A1G7MDW6_9PROT|nr:amidophosphoribosyltransferase [Limimonas halophila]SDF59846.1 amidophosphoribosyltransferase [Limimonas halophila]
MTADTTADTLREKCGVFGIYGHPDAAKHTALGLHALQHRGQEAAGLVTYNGRQFSAHRDTGHVGDIFDKPDLMERLTGHIAVGHNRYSTSGATAMRNIQPLFAELAFGGFALSHNGNLTNFEKLRRELVQRGALFQSTTDTEVLIHLMAAAPAEVEGAVDRMTYALQHIEGAYAFVAMTDSQLIGVRDPFGVRPLVLGRVGDSYVLASETCALDIIDAEVIRDIEPGEMVVIDTEGLRSLRPFPPRNRQRFCIFEYIYFARPDSVVEGSSVYEARRRIGQELARESHSPSDVVIPVPDSGVPAAIGYADEAQIPFEFGIIRNHYVGRTFIEPTQSIRNLGVKLKHNANRAMIEGKRVVLVDDSIVRGTTSAKIVKMVRDAGAKEVHMRIAAPPTRHSCYYGIDTPNAGELLASRYTVPDMASVIGCDSLAFISFDGMYRAMGHAGRNPDQPQFCDACFTGDYPIPLVDQEEDTPDTDLFSVISEEA